MLTVSVREARQRIGDLLDAAERGEEVIIERRGRPAARLVAVRRPLLESHASFREGIPAGGSSAADLVRAMRDEERS